jgi:hypothetical protein
VQEQVSQRDTGDAQFLGIAADRAEVPVAVGQVEVAIEDGYAHVDEVECRQGQ